MVVFTSILIRSCSRDKEKREVPSYEDFLSQFPTVKTPYTLDPKFILRIHTRSYDIKYPPLIDQKYEDKYLSQDSSTIHNYFMNDTLYTTRRALEPIGKTITGNFDVVLYQLTTGGKRFYRCYRMGIFKDEKLVNSFNIALSAISVRSTNYLVTATISGNKIDQYKIAMEYHEEPNNFELGNEDYYFTLQDTLAVSTLEIQTDGSILGKNLAELPDMK